MAGFTLQRREIVLQFAEDTHLHGLEVVAKLDIPLSLFLEFQTAISGDLSTPEGEENTEGINDGFSLWADSILIDWNLEDDEGKKVKPTKEAFFNLPLNDCMTIVQNWSAAVSEPDPLPSMISNNSKQSEKDSDELMVPSHANPPS
tara:strand:+ start:652 stop:1089 length:438 start_codon:yes stop_codon:yes gene_type:complete